MKFIQQFFQLLCHYQEVKYEFKKKLELLKFEIYRYKKENETI